MVSLGLLGVSGDSIWVLATFALFVLSGESVWCLRFPKLAPGPRSPSSSPPLRAHLPRRRQTSPPVRSRAQPRLHPTQAVRCTCSDLYVRSDGAEADDVGGWDRTDVTCICTSMVFSSEALACVQSTCDAADEATALADFQEFCAGGEYQQSCGRDQW